MLKELEKNYNEAWKVSTIFNKNIKKKYGKIPLGYKRESSELFRKVDFTKLVVKPLADLVIEASDFVSYTIYPPTGLSASVITVFEDDNGERFSLSLEYRYQKNGNTISTFYDTFKKDREVYFKKGTIGNLNHLDNITKRLPNNIESILKIIKKGKVRKWKIK